MCDASNYIIRVVLGQQKEKKSHVICASRTLNFTKCNYSTTKNELLAIVFVVDKFRSYLLGSKVIIFSDHTVIGKEGIKIKTRTLDSFVARV